MHIGRFKLATHFVDYAIKSAMLYCEIVYKHEIIQDGKYTSNTYKKDSTQATVQATVQVVESRSTTM